MDALFVLGDLTIQSPNATDFVITSSGGLYVNESASATIATNVLNYGTVQVDSLLELPNDMTQNSDDSGRNSSILLRGGQITGNLVVNSGIVKGFSPFLELLKDVSGTGNVVGSIKGNGGIVLPTGNLEVGSYFQGPSAVLQIHIVQVRGFASCFLVSPNTSILGVRCVLCSRNDDR